MREHNIPRRHLARVVYKSRAQATLTGDDPAELRERAYRFASARHWHRAIVTLSESHELESDPA